MRQLWTRTLIDAAAVAAIVLAIVGCGNVSVRPHNPVGTATLKPTLEDQDAGLVGIADGFNVRSYRLVAVDRFAVTDSLSDDDDKELARTIPAYLQAELVRRLRETALFERVVGLSEADLPTGATNVLRLKGEISQIAGGSRGLRFWIGFGAGRSKFQAETRFVDNQSGALLMVTANRRVAAMSEAMSLDYGGSSEDLIKQSCSDMARDLARFLVRLSKGQGPAPN